MDNNYFTNVGSYMQPVDPNELARLNPVFQNIGMQQANQNAAMQQGMNLTNQAGMTGKGQQAGVNMDPKAMAEMLRKGKDMGANVMARADMAFNSQASPYLQDQVSRLGSSTSNPFSNYNMGTGGFGNYGE
jgi:hypothetical protein